VRRLGRPSAAGLDVYPIDLDYVSTERKIGPGADDDPYVTMNAAPTEGDPMEFADRIERLRAISSGMADLYSNDELLAVDVGYAYAGPLSAEQAAVEADSILDALLEAA
jgi:hypothetical protein